MWGSSLTGKELKYSEFLQMIETHQITSFEMNINSRVVEYYTVGSKVKQHYDWSRKDCPTWLRSGKFGYNWTWFKNQITSNSAVTQPSTGTGTNGSFVVKITTASLNVRKGPGTSHAVVTTVKKGEAYTITEVRGSWGKLKSGVGWINISPNYVKRV